MKKILLINSSLSQGGSERVMTVLANGLKKKGYEVHMVLLRKKEATYKLDDDIKCTQLNYSSDNKMIIFFERIFKLRKIIKNYSGKYVISFMDDINKMTLLSGMFLRKRIIVSERAFPLVGRSKLDRFIENVLYLFAYKVVFQTEEAKNYYSSKVIKKSVVIPNPIDSNLPDCNFVKKEKKIVAVGRLCEQKNFEMLIRAFNEVSKNFKDYQLVIYGDGPKREELNKLIINLNLSKKVKLPGYVADVNKKMESAQVYVSTSNYEGISNSILEAVAMGIPSICTDCPVGGSRLVIDNMKNGILIPVGDEEKLKQSLITLLNSKKLREKLSFNGVKIRKKFSTEVIVDMWNSVMKN